MSINRIYLSSILLSKKDLCNLSTDDEGNVLNADKIRENSFNHYKNIFEKCGYETEKDKKNSNLIIFDNNKKIHFDLSTLIIEKSPEKIDYLKLFSALKEAGVQKMSSSDLSDYQDIQKLISRFNLEAKNEGKKSVKYGGRFDKIGDVDYVDIANVGKIDNIYSLSTTVRKEIKKIKLDEIEQVNQENQEKEFEAYINELDKRGFKHNNDNYKKALEEYKKQIPASKVSMKKFDAKNSVVSKNLIKISVRGSTNIDRIWKNLQNNEVEHFVDKNLLENAVRKIRKERVASLTRKKEEHEAKIKQEKAQTEAKKKKISQRREAYRNQSVTLFNKFNSPDVNQATNDNVKPTDYDMTVSHVEEALLSPENKISDIQNKIFEDKDVVKSITNQWKDYVSDAGLKHNHISNDLKSRAVSVRLYKNSKDKFLHKRGLSKADFTEIIDHGNKVDIVGKRRKNLYDDIVKMAIKRGFKTINFGKIRNSEDKEKLLLSCARFGISPKGCLPNNQKTWAKADKLLSDNGHNIGEFYKFRAEKTHQNKAVTLNKPNQINNDSMVG